MKTIKLKACELAKRCRSAPVVSPDWYLAHIHAICLSRLLRQTNPCKVIFQVSRRQVMVLISVFYQDAVGILAAVAAWTSRRQETAWRKKTASASQPVARRQRIWIKVQGFRDFWQSAKWHLVSFLGRQFLVTNTRNIHKARLKQFLRSVVSDP